MNLQKLSQDEAKDVVHKFITCKGLKIFIIASVVTALIGGIFLHFVNKAQKL